MKLVANLKLMPSPSQHAALLDTITTANRACTWLAGQAWDTHTFGQFVLHTLAYHPCREKFLLAAQMVVRCIAKVADAYKLDQKKRRRFKRYAAQPYDDRIFRFCSDTEVSLWSTQGRLTIPYQCGERQRALLAYRKGEIDLMYIRGVFYLAVVCDVLEPEEMGIERILGVDAGIALEDLTGIRQRVKARRIQRPRQANWGFAQLRQYITYKAAQGGVPVILVDARYTSQRCNQCGHVEKANRQSQSKFSCKKCGYSTNADFNAAQNIKHRAAVNRRMVAQPRQLRLALA
jgi:IS605 OrfB family transposase